MMYMIGALTALFLLGADQWLKNWITVHLPLGETMELLPGFVQLRSVHNYGAAWSSFSGQKWLLVAVTAGIILAVAFVLVRRIVRHPVGVLACFLILAGGIGNLIDRVRMGYVVDMFDFQFMNYPVFNVADIAVVSGAVLAVCYYVWLYEKHDRRDAKHGDSDAPSE